MTEDVYYKKTIAYNFWKHHLEFQVSQELFSSASVDLGTQFLLRTLVEAGYPQPKSLLDMGCGYGPLGLTLKSLYPDCLTHLVDRDALAVNYTRRNVELNGLTGTEVYGSLGYDEVTKNDFDLIVSNIPGKAGEDVITYLLREAVYYLAPNGVVAIVVVDPLEELVTRILTESSGITILVQRKRPGHVVYHYRFIAPPESPQPHKTALLRGVYTRNRMHYQLYKQSFDMQTARGLPEFDSLDYRSEMVIKALHDLRGNTVHRTAVFNPGQGHFAVAIWKFLHPAHIVLVDRDLLALFFSQINLVANACPPDLVNPSFRVGIGEFEDHGIDLFSGVLREEEGQAAVLLMIQQMLKALSRKGRIVLGGGSTAITRLVTWLKLNGGADILVREKYRGYSLLVLERS